MNTISKRIPLYEKFNVDINKMKENRNDSSKLISNKSVADFRKASAEKEINSISTNNMYESYISKSNIIIRHINSKYLEKFDEVSYSFGKALNNGDDTSQNDILEKMAAEYENLRKDIFKNYSGENLDEQLKQLDEAYDTMTQYNIANPIEHNLYKAQNKEKIRSMFEEIRAKFTKAKGQRFADMVFGSARYNGKNTVFDNALYNKVFTMSKNVMRLAERAKQYIKDGNHAPVTEEEKNTFNKYISDGTDGTIGNLSYCDIKAVLSVAGNIQKLDSEWLSNNDNYNNILNSFNNSDFSDEVKNLLSNVLNQTSWNNYEPKDEQEKIEAEIIDLIEKREADLYNRKNSSEVLTDEEKYKRYIDDVKYNNIINEKTEALFNLE